MENLNLKLNHLYLMALATLAVFNSFVPRANGLSVPNPCQGISRGRNFVIGFTDHIFVKSRKLSILVVAFSDEDTEVTISSKYQVNAKPFQQTILIKARGFQTIDVPEEYIMDVTERSMKGIKISASSDVSVYGLSFQDYSSDGFLSIPVNNLGMQYVVVTPSDTSTSAGWTSLFAVVGTQDSTSVQVILRTTGPVTFENQTYLSGDEINFIVRDLEAVQIQSQPGASLTGSIIQSDKPVSVFSGYECIDTPGSACDTVTEQLVPVKSWGHNHLYTAFSNSDSNIYNIVAYFENTTVTIPGNGDQLLNAGDAWEGSLIGSGLVSSNNPTLMMQLLATINGSTVDPSLIQIPSVEQLGYEFGFTTPPYSGEDAQGFFNFLNIVVKGDSQHSVVLNGEPIQSISSRTSSAIPDTEYIVVTIEVPKGEGVYYVEQTDTSASPLSVIVYGYERSESYGYAAGLSLPSNRQLLSFSPFYFREMGGDKITVTVPCVKLSNSIDYPNSICKFHNGFEEVLVLGDRKGPFTVHCITPTFYQIGLTEVHVSLDDGETFPYSGNIYVASQDDLPPLLMVEQVNWEERGRAIDLKVDDQVLLSWDPTVLEEGVSFVDIMVQNFDIDSNGQPILGEEETLIMGDVKNTGNAVFLPATVRSHFEDKTSNGKTDGKTASPLAVVSLRPSNMETRRRRGIPIPAAVVFGGVSIFLYSDLDCNMYDSILSKKAKDVPPCPCNFAQANGNFNFQLSNHGLDTFHPGAVNCFRASSLTSLSGQQCCYGSDGNIIVGPPGGGTEDRYAPNGIVSTARHFLYDVVPWYACCYLSNKCDTYYAHRPSDDCSNYDPPRPARAAGDPHMTTLDGKEFTFNGAGEFLMLSSLIHNLTVQARMEVYRDTEATVYTAVVVQTNDSAKVQIEKSRTNQTYSVLIDGEPLHLATSPIKVFNFNGVQISSAQDSLKVRIVFKIGVAFIFHMQSEVMSFIVQLSEKFQGQVRGLLGNLNGDPNDDFQFPNGTIISNLSSLKEVHEYALTWMIAEEDSIFTYVSPFDYNTYHFPDFQPIFDIPNADNVSQEIRDVCGDSFACIFDAVTTGSLAVANETLVVSATFDIIQKSAVKVVSCGFPGKVENAEILGQVYLVNSTLNITCDDGYTLHGSSMLTCNADGQWSSEPPLCVAPDMPDKSSNILGISLGVTAAVIAVTVVLIVLMMKKMSMFCFG